MSVSQINAFPGYLTDTSSETNTLKGACQESSELWSDVECEFCLKLYFESK